MSNFLEHAKAQWAGVELADLKKDAKAFGIAYNNDDDADTIRARLLAAIGEIAPVSRQDAPRAKLPRPTEKPNLTTIGKWGGLCRDVTVYRPQGDSAPGCPISWDEMRIYIPFDDGSGKRYTIPEPHYHSLNNAKLRNMTVNAKAVDGIINRNEVTTEQLTYPFSGGEYTPSTEHLPGSLLQWYQWEAERKDYFARFRKARLEEIYSELTGRQPMTFFGGGNVKEWDREKTRSEVLRFLGMDYIAKMQISEEDPDLVDATLS